LENGEVFSDRGADYYNQFNRERKVNALLHNLHLLSWQMPISLRPLDFVSFPSFIGKLCAFKLFYYLVSKK